MEVRLVRHGGRAIGCWGSGFLVEVHDHAQGSLDGIQEQRPVSRFGQVVCMYERVELIGEDCVRVRKQGICACLSLGVSRVYV